MNQRSEDFLKMILLGLFDLGIFNTYVVGLPLHLMARALGVDELVFLGFVRFGFGFFEALLFKSKPAVYVLLASAIGFMLYFYWILSLDWTAERWTAARYPICLWALTGVGAVCSGGLRNWIQKRHLKS